MFILDSRVLHGHFIPVNLLQASKNDDKKRCFFHLSHEKEAHGEQKNCIA